MTDTTTLGEPGGDISPQDRLDWLKRRAAVWVIAFLILVLAAVGSLFAFGVFTAQTAHTVTFGTGSIGISHDHTSGSLLEVTGLVPGDEASEVITVTKTDSAPGRVVLTGLKNPTGSQALADALHLTITETDGPNSTQTPEQIYTGTLSGLLEPNAPTTLGPDWVAANHARQYQIKVSFPKDLGDETFYQNLKNQTVTVMLIWKVTAIPTTTAP